MNRLNKIESAIFISLVYPLLPKDLTIQNLVIIMLILLIPFQAAVNDSVINTTLDALPSCSDSYYEYLPPLWQSDFVVAVIYCTLVGLAFCMGTFGNIIILIITITTRTVKKIGRDFFINLALADLCVSLVGQPMCILGRVYTL